MNSTTSITKFLLTPHSTRGRFHTTHPLRLVASTDLRYTILKMGGDGGVVATNRKYMRGAGTADHTGDSSVVATATAADVKANQQREALEVMTTCAISKAKLRPGDSFVACRLGRLYLKEAAVQALLRRKTGQSSGSGSTEEVKALAHIKKLSDLYPVRGNTSIVNDSITWTCPITSKTLNGSVPPALLLVPGNIDNANVVSDFAHKQLSEQEMQLEYGPIERKIRLAPTPQELAEVQAQLDLERSDKKIKKSKVVNNNTSKDSVGKRKREESSTKQQQQQQQSRASHRPAGADSVGSVIRSRVDSALKSNQVLASLFSDKQQEQDKPPPSSEKNRKDNLFVR